MICAQPVIELVRDGRMHVDEAERSDELLLEERGERAVAAVDAPHELVDEHAVHEYVVEAAVLARLAHLSRRWAVLLDQVRDARRVGAQLGHREVLAAEVLHACLHAAHMRQLRSRRTGMRYTRRKDSESSSGRHLNVCRLQVAAGNG